MSVVVSNLCIRRARREEIPEIVALIGRAHAETYAPPEVDIAQYLAESAARAKGQRRLWRTYLVAELEGRIVGAVQLPHDLVNALYVDRDWRGRGVGAGLLSTAEAALRAKGVGRAEVHIADGYPRVRAFYERHGWEAGPRGEPRKDAQWGLRLLAMNKPIGPVDEARHRLAGAVLKATRIVLAAAIAFVALASLRLGGLLTEQASFVAALALALLTAECALRVRHFNFTFARNLLVSAGGVAAFLALPVGTIVLAALALQALGLGHQPPRDRSTATLLMLCLLMAVTWRPANFLFIRCLQRFL